MLCWLAFRHLIHSTLSHSFGADYWNNTIPTDIQTIISDRISERSKSKVLEYPKDPSLRLQFADIMDYHKIIDKQWNLFEDRFGSREELRSRFRAVKNYRNPLGHNRDLNPIDQERGDKPTHPQTGTKFT